jgi:hypothetical protein
MNNALVPSPLKIHGAIVHGGLKMHLARFELEPGKIVVYQHSWWLAGFGLLGLWISRKAQGKRVLDLELSKIAVIGRGKYGLNKKIVEITMTTGEQYRFNLGDDKAALIRNHVAQWNQLVEAGPEKWQVLRRTELPPLGPSVVQPQPRAQA